MAVAAVLALAGLPVGKYLPFGVLLICPLMMFGMMRMMGRHDGKGDHHHGERDANQEHDDDEVASGQASDGERPDNSGTQDVTKPV